MFSPLFLFISTTSGMSAECSEEWGKILQFPVNPGIGKDYALMWEYSGFNFNNLGNFDECKKIDRAKYALLVYSESPVIVETLCGPSNCTEEDYFTFSALPPGVVVFPEKYQRDRYHTYSSGAICMLVFIGIITAIAIMGTFMDYLVIDSRDSIGFRILLCFSILSNGKRLLTTRSQERLGKPDALGLLDGIRVMSIGWVILGHTCLNYFSITAISNFQTAVHELSTANYIIVYGGFYAVDSFFWLSGLLMSYLFILEVHKTATFSMWKLAMVYIHRYLRITPVFMFAALFFWSMQVYLGSGPLWVDIGSLTGDCDKHWYTNMIYLNNFIPDWKTSNCLGVGWYLADDMQYFVISPVIILLYCKYNKLFGWAAVGLLCILSVVTSGYVAHHFNLSPAIFAASNGSNYFDFYYNKPYTRVAPYALGVACGFIVYSYRKYQDTNEVYDSISLMIAKSQEKWYIRVITFIVGLALLNVLIFSQYDNYKHPGSGLEYHHWSRTDNIAFIALERLVYGLAMSCIFLPMVLGHFKPITAFLSLYPFSLLARFTFAIYLIHYSIIQTMLRSQKNVLILDEYNNIRDTIYFFIVSLMFAVPVVLLIEMPSGNLEKLLFGKAPPHAKPKEEAFLRVNQELSSVKG